MREAEIKRALTHYLDTSLGIHPGLFLEELQPVRSGRFSRLDSVLTLRMPNAEPLKRNSRSPERHWSATPLTFNCPQSLLT